MECSAIATTAPQPPAPHSYKLPSPPSETPEPPGEHLDIVRDVVRDDWAALRARHLHHRADDNHADPPFVRYARQQHVCHYLLRRLDTARQSDLLPATWLAGMATEQARLAHVAARLPGVLAEVTRAMAAADVETRVLKGRPFAVRYFGDAELRRLVDVDVLVRRDRVNAALGVLWSLGFRTKPRRVDMTDDGPVMRARPLRTEHAMAFIRDGVNVDLHWRLRNAPAYRINENDVWAAPQTVEVDGETYSVLSDEYELLLLLLSIAHDIGRCACRLKHLLDVYQMLRSGHAAIDWPAFFERRAADRTLGVCVNVLWIVLDVFECADDLPALRDALAPYAARRVEMSVDEEIAMIHRAPGTVDNAVWLGKVYPISPWRDLVWLTDRNVTHVGRLYVSFYRTLRFLLRLGCYYARRPTGR